MNICELRQYNAAGIVIKRISFLAYPFAAPLNLRIQQPQKRQNEIGNNLFRDGSEMSYSQYDNATITLQPTVNINCTEDKALGMIEALRVSIELMIDEARANTLGKSKDYIRFAEDTKGLVLESEIIEGDFDINDDWSWSNIAQGVIAEVNLSLVRRPFRLNPVQEIIQNYLINPSFEILRTGSSTQVPTTWNASIFSAPVIDTHSIQGLNAIKIPSFTLVANGDNAGLSQRLNPVPVIGDVYYVEFWVNVGVSNPANTSWLISHGEQFGVTEWTYGEVVVNKDPRWYRAHSYNRDDALTTYAQSLDVLMLRKGVFFRALSSIQAVGLVPRNKQFTTGGPTADIYADKAYATKASNFLTPEKLASIAARIDAGIVVTVNGFSPVTTHAVPIDPGARIGDADYMPQAWGSSAVVSQVYDEGSFGYTNYIDIEDVDGDVPAKMELTLTNNLAPGAAAINEMTKAILAGMTSKGIPYATRNKIVAPIQDGSIGTPVDPTINSLETISAAPGQLTIDNVAYGALSDSPWSSGSTTTKQVKFTLETGVGRTKLAGAYHILVRMAATSAVSGIRARVVLESWNTFDVRRYTKETSLPPVDSAGASYYWADLGVMRIPELEDNNYFQLLVQFRNISGSVTAFVDAISLVPADEWFVTGQSNLTLNSNYWLKAGDLDERGNPVLSVGGLSSYTAEFQAAATPYIVPRRTNRIYMHINRVGSAGAYFTARKIPATPGYLVMIRYQERYL